MGSGLAIIHSILLGTGDIGSKTTWHRLVILKEAANGDIP